MINTSSLQRPSCQTQSLQRAHGESSVQGSAQSQSRPYLGGMIGRSQVMKQLFQQLDRVAVSTAPLLITGETGTGKELVARAVHAASGRGRFVPVNCGAIPESLLESELFGHVRGAFTGADSDRTGLFEMAEGGTLFLDEIAEMPLALQSKLLRVLQFGELRRVGDSGMRHVQVRVITATHRDLRVARDEGTFREDLFYRIHVLKLDVPPLRERPADIPLLAENFIARIHEREGVVGRRFSAAALGALVAYPWPGNVRELENVLEHAVLLTDETEIGIHDLPAEIRRATPVSTNTLSDRVPTLAEVERTHILRVLDRVGGNRSRAAVVLGVSRRTLHRRLDEYGVGDR
jgi:two-component system, NtrC family, response regulator AtoC